MIHRAPDVLHQNTIPLSLVALERLIERRPEEPVNSSKVLDPAQKTGDRTMQVTGDIEALRGNRTPYHQRIYPSKAILPGLLQLELSEMRAIREVQ